MPVPNGLANTVVGGYLAGQEADQRARSGQLQQMGALQGILANAQKQQQMQQGMAEEQQLKGMLAQTGGNPEKAIAALMQAGTPKSLALAAQLKSFAPKPAEAYTLAPGGQRFGPDNVMVAEAPMREPKGQNVSNLQRLMLEREALSATDPMRDAYNNAIRKESETARQINPVTNIHNPAPVTPVTIADPNDPSKTILVDGRTGRKIGDGPKLTQTGLADQKLALKLPEARKSVEMITQNIDKLDQAIAELYVDKGLSNITGSIMGRTGNISNTATGAQAKLDSIKSQIFQSSLQAMREASKTGGAVGNVSDREGDKLERTIAALDQLQGTPDFKVQLNKARAQLRQSKGIIRSAFEEQFAGVQSAPAAAAGPAAPTVESLLDKYK